jgi:hypothetical protein
VSQHGTACRSIHKSFHLWVPPEDISNHSSRVVALVALQNHTLHLSI